MCETCPTLRVEEVQLIRGNVETDLVSRFNAPTIVAGDDDLCRSQFGVQ